LPAGSHLASIPAAYSYGYPAHDDGIPYYAEAKKAPNFQTTRRRLNVVAMVLSVILPWLLFSLVFAVLSFSIHYSQTMEAYLYVGLGFLFVVIVGVAAHGAMRRDPEHYLQYQPTWLVFFFVTCLLAWILAVVGGKTNFHSNMQPFYDITNLNSYILVDPSKSRGQRHMDAGRIIFTANAHLNVRLSTNFMNHDAYCVAPITVAGPSNGNMSRFDFWAVGKNCCRDGDFRCDAWDDPKAKGGLREMEDEDRPFYRLAVQQAQAKYGIKAEHPLFFHWVRDPALSLVAYQYEGFKYYFLGMFGHFVLQIALVLLAAMSFTKRSETPA